MDTVTEYILYQQILENKVQLKVLLLPLRNFGMKQPSNEEDTDEEQGKQGGVK